MCVFESLITEYKCALFYCASLNGLGLQYVFFVFFFNKLKFRGLPVSSKSMDTIFPAAFTHFVFLCHIFVQTFYYICYGDL